MNVYIEKCATPIYNRIALALGRTLLGRGFKVMMVNPSAFNENTYIDFLKAGIDSIYISTAPSNLIQQHTKNNSEAFFESFRGKLIFVHQDSILGGIDIETAVLKLASWRRVAERSFHLCIEEYCTTVLQEIGIHNTKVVNHATEFEAVTPTTKEFDYGSTFVGHVIPPEYYLPNENHKVEEFLKSTIYNRLTNFEYDINNSIKQIAPSQLFDSFSIFLTPLTRLALIQWLKSQLANRSLQYRGAVFQSEKIQQLDIFGGDPAYLHGVNRSIAISNKNAKYHPAVYGNELQNVYKNSSVSINITSLQFDNAVVNRVLDIFMSGGLCLTDARPGLIKVTSHYRDISFKNQDELIEKINYFSDPKNYNDRANLIECIQSDIKSGATYESLSDHIVSAIDNLG